MDLDIFLRVGGNAAGIMILVTLIIWWMRRREVKREGKASPVARVRLRQEAMLHAHDPAP